MDNILIRVTNYVLILQDNHFRLSLALTIFQSTVSCWCKSQTCFPHQLVCRHIILLIDVEKISRTKKKISITKRIERIQKVGGEFLKKVCKMLQDIAINIKSVIKEQKQAQQNLHTYILKKMDDAHRPIYQEKRKIAKDLVERCKIKSWEDFGNANK